MVQLNGYDADKVKDCRCVFDITKRLLLDNDIADKYKKTPIQLLYALMGGSLTVSELLLTGLYGPVDKRSVVTANRNISYMTDARYRYITKRMDGRKDAIGVWTITKEGTDVICDKLSALSAETDPLKGNRKRYFFTVTDTELDALKRVFEENKRWKSPANLMHSCGINDFLVSLFSTSVSTPCFFREVNVYRSADEKKASFHYVYDGSRAFRMDALGFLKGCMESDPVIPLFYEQDTGSQSGSVLAQKAANYKEFFSTLLRDKELYHGLPLSLVFGLQYSSGISVKKKEISNGAKTRAENKRKRLISMLMYAGGLLDDNSISYVTSLLEHRIATDSTNTRDYKESLQLIREITAADPACRHIDDLKMAVLEDDNPDKDTESGIFNARASLAFFINRRNLLFTKFSSLDTFLFYSGVRIVTLPNSCMSTYMPYVYPHELGLDWIIQPLLAHSGNIFSGHPQYSPMQRILDVSIPNTYVFADKASRHTVFFENFSLDYGSRVRIPAALTRMKNMNDEKLAAAGYLIVCFFLSEDLPLLREFVLAHCKDFASPDANHAFMPAAPDRILFICMDDVLAAGPEARAIRFDTAGNAYYHMQITFPALTATREYIPADATDVAEKRPYNDTDTP